MWASILSFVLGLLGKIFGIGQPADPEATAEKTGESAGEAKAQAAAATEEVSELQTAAKARQDSEATHAGQTPDQIRQNAQGDPNARKFDPDAVG